LKVVKMKESLVKTLLHHIFGILAIVRYPLRHGQHSPLVTKNQFLEGERLCTLGSGHQRSVGVLGHSTRTNGFHSSVPPRHLFRKRPTLNEAIGAPQAAGDDNGLEVADGMGDQSIHVVSGQRGPLRESVGILTEYLFGWIGQGVPLDPTGAK
jgi:hypothetical protein